MARVFDRWHILSCEKRGAKVGATKRGKGTKILVASDGKGTPLAVEIESASPAEVKIAPRLLQKIAMPLFFGRGRARSKPCRVIADKSYDSEEFRQQLKKHHVALIIPARMRNRKATISRWPQFAPLSASVEN